MDGGAGPTGTQRRYRRTGIETRVDLEYRGVPWFVSGTSEDISVGGMFVRLAELPRTGTRVRFGFRLDPDDPVIRGLGEVAWVRASDEGPERCRGIAIRYVSLGDDERARIAAASRGDGTHPSEPGPPSEPVAVPFDDADTPPPPDDRPTDPRIAPSADEAAARTLPFPWPLVAGMVAVVVLVVSIGALVLGPVGGGSGGPKEAGRTPSDGASPGTPVRPSLHEASRIEAVRWSGGVGTTRIELEFDGILHPSRASTEALVRPPRFLLRVRGVTPGAADDLYEIAAADVRRMLVGEDPRSGELAVMLDLARPTVRVGVAIEGNRIVLETR